MSECLGLQKPPTCARLTSAANFLRPEGELPKQKITTPNIPWGRYPSGGRVSASCRSRSPSNAEATKRSGKFTAKPYFWFVQELVKYVFRRYKESKFMPIDVIIITPADLHIRHSDPRIIRLYSSRVWIHKMILSVSFKLQYRPRILLPLPFSLFHCRREYSVRLKSTCINCTR